MNITAARTFLEVVARGNLNRAAEHLNVTQSTVTTRINTLEAELGQQLLVRSRSGAQLTAAGFKFQRYAEILVQTWKQSQHEVSLPKGFDSACTMACHFDLWQGACEIWCDAMRMQHRQVALSIWPGDHKDISRWLDSGLADAAFIYDAQPRSGWSVRPLFDDRLIEVASERRPLVRWDPAYVYVDHGPEFRREHAAAYPVEETAAVSFGHSTWALDHVLRHGGSGYLPLRLVKDHIAAGRLHQIEQAAVFSRQVSMVSNDDSTGNWPWFEASLADVIIDS
ncbi:MAG: LysR family transcriptional regulator [Aestuariivirgaceae bacterium]